VDRQSTRYIELRTRISTLARRLPHPDPTGLYLPRQYDATLAFRLLCHAEIEACLEDISTGTLASALAAYKADGAARLPLLAVLAFYGQGKLPRRSGDSLEDFNDTLRRAVTEHYQAAAKNNGVRERNVATLMLPIGITTLDIDPVWLLQMDNFGQLRGDTAHQSMSTQRPPNPVDERATVRALLLGIGVLDRKLVVLSQ
jgi:hypothetical protein